MHRRGRGLRWRCVLPWGGLLRLLNRGRDRLGRRIGMAATLIERMLYALNVISPAINSRRAWRFTVALEISRRLLANYARRRGPLLHRFRSMVLGDDARSRRLRCGPIGSRRPALNVIIGEDAPVRSCAAMVVVIVIGNPATLAGIVHSAPVPGMAGSHHASTRSSAYDNP